MKNGVKKWVTKLAGNKYQCQKCDQVFSFHKYGRNLLAWSANQHFEYLLSMKKIQKMTLEYFNIQVPEHVLYKFKANLIEELNETVPNQVGKEITNPTLIWIFQFFRNIGVIKIKIDGITKTMITNLTNVHKKIISFFGETALNIYDILDDPIPDVLKLEQDKLLLN